MMWHGTPTPRRCLAGGDEGKWKRRSGGGTKSNHLQGKNCSRLEALPKSGQAPEAARARDGERLLPAGRFGSGLGAAVTQQHPSHSNPPVWQVAQHTNPRRGGQAGKGKGFFLVVRPAL